MMLSGPKLLVALDYPEANAALAMADRLDPARCRLKIGKELFTAEGPQIVRDVIGRGFDVFLDLKFHDIPNTVAGAVRAAADLGVWMVNVHASGGSRMMSAARAALDAFADDRPLLIAVTVLTSMGASDLAEIGVGADPMQQVSRLARLAVNSGMDGLVCSAQEAAMLREQLGQSAVLVTPGIRLPEQAGQDDQIRVMAPAEAIAAGADFLVVGRPITASDDPQASLQRFVTAMALSESR